MQPFVLPPNRFARFYAGRRPHRRPARRPAGPERTPEDWVGSTATSWGHQTEGLARLDDGRLLRDLVEADPEGFLGPEHVARWGANPAVLVKLLDAGERLPVHFHPGRPFAREHLDLDYGKTESLADPRGRARREVHVGFKEPADADTVRRWIDTQDPEEMLAALRPIEVKPGDAILVPAGTLHAIGAGILLLELQEPTDLSVLVEHAGFASDGSEHLDLGWDIALQAADLDPGTQDAAPRLPDEADPYFRAQPITAGDELEPSFAVLLVRRRGHAADRARRRASRCGAAPPRWCRSPPAHDHRGRRRCSAACRPTRPQGGPMVHRHRQSPHEEE